MSDVAPRPLANPERDWSRGAPLATLDRAEVERRVGSLDGPLAVLSGGLANVNVALDARRVLRIYRRDPSAARREAALLSRPWRSLRAPAVLDVGEDFLVLERVPHRPLDDTAASGAAAGRALAEIHAVRCDAAGFLGDDLAVARRFDDLVAALLGHLGEELGRAGARLPAGLAARAEGFALARAQALRAAAGPPVLLHGDFKVSNLHWTDDDRLLVLDWEFAYAGAALSDVGQLLRWAPGAGFVAAFEARYRAGGGALPDGWARLAAAFDLVNLAGLAAGGRGDARRLCDLSRRIAQTLDDG